jgi:hypothetical protein
MSQQEGNASAGQFSGGMIASIMLIFYYADQSGGARYGSCGKQGD